MSFRQECVWFSALTSDLCVSGLLQGAGQRQAAEAAGDREGQVLQPAGRGEDQGCRRSVCADRINTFLK